MDELRKKGLAKMNEVYGWEMPDMPGEYFALTVDHLFGTIWTRPGLSMRDRRMMLIGVLAALGMEELVEIQGNAILHNEEMTREELRRSRSSSPTTSASRWARRSTAHSNVSSPSARRPKRRAPPEDKQGQRQRRRPDARRQDARRLTTSGPFLRRGERD